MDAADIKNKAAELGYAGCGIIPPNAFTEYERFLRERVRSFPESRDLYGPMFDFIHPPAECRSIIVCVRGLSKYKVPENLAGRIGRTYLFDNRVPYSDDCRLRAEFKAYLELSGLKILPFTAPSRWAAVKAGLGKFGRNNFIYHPQHGSNVKIEAYPVDKALRYDEAPSDYYLPGCGEGCRKCVAACPTGALAGDYSMDHGKCVTHLTTFACGIPDGETRRKMGCWLYGCDVCQDVCLYNYNAPAGTEDYPLLAEYEEYLKPENIVEMDEETYQRVIFPRFWYAGKDGLWLWKCNALRMMINSGDAKYEAAIEKCRAHGDERLREIAERRD